MKWVDLCLRSSMHGCDREWMTIGRLQVNDTGTLALKEIGKGFY